MDICLLAAPEFTFTKRMNTLKQLHTKNNMEYLQKVVIVQVWKVRIRQAKRS